MHSLISKLLPGPVVTDGAWGTQLQAQGLRPGECPDAWNLSHPDRVESVARAYVAAGSQIILTNTSDALQLQLANHGLAERVTAINRAGVEISRRAAAGRALVFASIGPTGKMLVTEETTEDELRAVFEEQTAALAEAGADALLLETFADLDEARIAIIAAKKTGLPVVASFVFDSGPHLDRTTMGATPEQAVAAAGATFIGGCCGTSPAFIAAVAKAVRPS